MKNKSLILYWFLPLFLFLVQLLFTLNSFDQIRYEELAESVRNVYWLQNKTIYDGVSSNVGWYGLLLAVYNLFGFTLNTAKYVRLILYLISIFCLAAILKKYLGQKLSWFPLLVIGLSPTLLFFNTLQTSYGIDLQYLPICIFLISSLNLKNKLLITLFSQCLLGLISMIAWMSYPPFIFYFPALILFYFYQIGLSFRKKPFAFQILGTFVTFTSFLVPLGLVFYFIKDKALLWFDPKLGSGIFRGAGTLTFDGGIFWINLTHVLSDLFTKADSYYFDILSTEFTGFYPAIGILISFVIGIYLTTRKKYRFLLIVVWSVFLFNLVISSFTFDPSGRPGIRRFTPVLASIYVLFTISWYKINNLNKDLKNLRWLIVIIFMLIPAHHIAAYFTNYNNLQTTSLYSYPLFFNVTNRPNDSLDLFVKKTMSEDFQLGCQDKDQKIISCRYSEIFAAVAGSCEWNKLNCHQILGYDEQSGKFIPISTGLWESYYWEH